MNKDSLILSPENAEEVSVLLNKVLTKCLNFKNRKNVFIGDTDVKKLIRKYTFQPSEEGESEKQLLSLIDDLLSDSYNFSTPAFMGFPDAGNSVPGLIGGLIEALCQQNLLNSSFCAKAATATEIVTVNLLREKIGFVINQDADHSKHIGGVSTPGGSYSNMLSVLMARKRALGNSFEKGVGSDAVSRLRAIIPGKIAHYSVLGAFGTLGLGTEMVVRVDTSDFSYDAEELEKTLTSLQNQGKTLFYALINAGDSRTLSIEPIEATIKRIKNYFPDCWIHVDACHGGQLLFSEKHLHKLKGINLADSITVDPHKVFNLSYVLSFFLCKQPESFDDFWLSSSLIMKDRWSLGQLTPGLGSKSWMSIKLYLLLRVFGSKNLEKLINERIENAMLFRKIISEQTDFCLFTKKTDINSVPFIYVGQNPDRTADYLYELNQNIYNDLVEEGRYYLHGFPVNDDSNMMKNGREQVFFVLRFMSGNSLLTSNLMQNAIDEIRKIGRSYEKGC